MELNTGELAGLCAGIGSLISYSIGYYMAKRSTSKQGSIKVKIDSEKIARELIPELKEKGIMPKDMSEDEALDLLFKANLHG